MKYKGSLYPAIITILILTLSQCAPLPCTLETDATLKASFFSTGTGTAVAADSVTLFGIGRDTSIIYNKAKSLRSISFPLNSGSDSCSFYIKLNTLTDTITFYYTNYTHLVSKECGYTFYHTLDSIKHTRTVHDYNIMNRDITTINAENIRIFF